MLGSDYIARNRKYSNFFFTFFRERSKSLHIFFLKINLGVSSEVLGRTDVVISLPTKGDRE